MKQPKIALIRGQFLNQFDMQSYEPLLGKYDITAFGSLHSIHKDFAFPSIGFPSLTDLPNFPKKMPILNRVCIDANYLIGLEKKLKGYDIAHSAETYYGYTQQVLIAKKKGYVKKVVVTVWENIPFNNEGIWGRKRFKENTKKYVDRFIAVTHLSQSALLAEGFDQGKISVITPGIDIKRFAPSMEYVKNLGKEKKEITILFVGRMEKYKGIFDILTAAEKIKKDKKFYEYSIQYIFVGEGSEKENFRQAAVKKGLDQAMMYITADYARIHEIYDMADVFVAPSKKDRFWVEQYGMALLEAQAMGLPIVATKSGGIPENIGDCGVLVEEGDTKALAESLGKFILEPRMREEYAIRARKRAEEVHSSILTSAKIDEVYKDVLQK